MSTRYQLSFTTGGLFVAESSCACELYSELRDWSLVREKLIADNLLQVRTRAASLRLSKEVVSRLEFLTNEEAAFLLEADIKAQVLLLWVAICRKYAFIHDLACEAIREGHLAMRRRFNLDDYESFWSAKALWHDELDALSESTRKKLRQNLFRMLKESGLLSEDFLIQAVVMPPLLADLLAVRGAKQFMIFPLHDHEIRLWVA